MVQGPPSAVGGNSADPENSVFVEPEVLSPY